MAVRASGRITLVGLADFSYQRPYYLLQDSTLAAPGAPSTNPPAAPWSTTEPSYTPGATVTLYRVDLGVWGDGTFQYGPVQVDSKYEAAKAAYNAAAAAQQTASSAMTTADGKSTIVRSANVAGGAGAYKLGDQWWQYSGANVIAMWLHDGTQWVSYKMNYQVLGQLDATNITVGELNAAILKGRSVTIDKLLITSMDNLIQDPGFEANTTAAWNLTSPTTNVATNPRTGARALAMGTQGSAYVGAMTAPSFRVEEGEQYRVGFWIRAAAANTSSNPVAVRFNTGTTEASTPTATADIQLGYADGATSYANVSTTYARVSGLWTVPAGVKYARLAIVSRDLTTGRTYYIDDMEMIKMAQGRLIVDGAIDGKTITGATIRTAASGQRLQLDSFGLRAFDTSGNQTATLYSDNGAMSLGGVNPSLSFRRTGEAYNNTSVEGGVAEAGGRFASFAIRDGVWRGVGSMDHRIVRDSDNAYASELGFSVGPANNDPGDSVYFTLNSTGTIVPPYRFLTTLDRSILSLNNLTTSGEASRRNGALFGCNVASLGSFESKGGATFQDSSTDTRSTTGINDLTVGKDYANVTVKNTQVQARGSGGATSPLLLQPDGGDILVGPEQGKVVTDTGWVNITAFGGGWTPGTGSEQPRVRRVGSRVDLVGKVNRGSSSAGLAAIMNIPAGYRTAFTSGNTPVGFAMENGGNAIMLYINNSTNNIFISTAWVTAGTVGNTAQINLLCSWYVD